MYFRHAVIWRTCCNSVPFVVVHDVHVVAGAGVEALAGERPPEVAPGFAFSDQQRRHEGAVLLYQQFQRKRVVQVCDGVHGKVQVAFSQPALLPKKNNAFLFFNSL